MKSIRCNLRREAVKGDERKRTAVCAPSADAVYEAAFRNGVGRAKALEAVAAGTFVCWCGRSDDDVCLGGARRLIGCPLILRRGAVS